MKNVLFVCKHNAGRSQMAQAFLNHLAAERGLTVHAKSAGIVGSREINPVVIEAMEEVGISLEGQFPKQLMCWHLDYADRVITMHCGAQVEGCNARVGQVEDWNLEDPEGQDIEKVRSIRDQVRERVEALLADMSAEALVEGAATEARDVE